MSRHDQEPAIHRAKFKQLVGYDVAIFNGEEYLRLDSETMLVYTMNTILFDRGEALKPGSFLARLPAAAQREVEWAVALRGAGVRTMFFHDDGAVSKINYGLSWIPMWSAPVLIAASAKPKLASFSTPEHKRRMASILRDAREDLAARGYMESLWRLGGVEKLADWIDDTFYFPEVRKTWSQLAQAGTVPKDGKQ